MISAKIVCDSVSPQGHRLTTFKLRYPTFIHGECKTHRVIRLGDEGGYELVQEIGFMDDPNLSRNASSSRAVPVWKNLEEVRSDDLRAEPVFWGAEQKGMSPGGELDDVEKVYTGLNGEPISKRERARLFWRSAALDAASRAERLMALGAHKSLVNRILSPYLHYNVVCTATEYMNFFGLRLDKAADPTMKALAEAMWREYNECKPTMLQPGNWHLPFVSEQDELSIMEMTSEWDRPDDGALGVVRRISVARCARVSYESFETGKRSTVEEDLKLYERLVGAQPLHASPAEHQATPDDYLTIREDNTISRSLDTSIMRGWQYPKQHGNFIGWRQYRKMIPGEALAPIPEEYQMIEFFGGPVIS